jgi:hypothetical protein
MPETPALPANYDAPGLYEICIQGHLDNSWASWFDGLTITLEESGETRLTGAIVDQAALHSLLRKVRDLAMPLLAVRRIEPGSAGTSAIDKLEHLGE